jgi:cyclase
MVVRERVAENVYYFQSKEYALVNSGVIVGQDMVVVVDTLAYPRETEAIRKFIDNTLELPPKYLVNTHSHADHSWGNDYFRDSQIISHKLCREFLNTNGRRELRASKLGNNTFSDTNIVLPEITFSDGEFGIKIEKKTVKLFPLPGHSADNIGVLIEEDRVLFSGDTFMSLPFIVDGDLEQSIESFHKIDKLGLENVVQGHGDVILRGEIGLIVEKNIHYLRTIESEVKKAYKKKFPLDVLEACDIESCGISRVILNGLGEQLHQQNLMSLYIKMYGETPIGSEVYFEK